MSQRQAKPAKSTAPLPTDYAPLLADIKARVQSARIKAGLAANRELLALYWDIGRLILDRQQREGWGAKVIDRLAVDLQRAFPQMTGFSRTNLLYTRAFAEAWRELAIVQRPVAQLTKAKRSPAVTGSSTASAEIVQQPVGQLAESIVQPSGAQFPTLPPEPLMSLPWGHNVMLLDKLTSPADRIWYAAKAVEHGWSRNVLALQIEAGLHRRQGKAVTNFKTTLPPAQSDLAQGITKDPYLFDFLTLRNDANERAVEVGLVAHVEKFLLELGAGFALVGRQVPLEVGDQDFYLDLLFYHLKLRCYVVIDLKAREFTPEAAGKMNFYLSAVDDRFRLPGDQPSIGLILCRSKNRVIAEYALRDMTKPIGVAGYVTKLVDSLPKAFKDAVPSVAELEKGLAPKTP
jgi:predicted nuclease of restriction endonuclease-like (RecB) superfamily